MLFNNNINIGNKKVNKKNCFIVAEISANHCGNIKTLKNLLLKIKKSGADAAKIQAYQADTITIDSARKDFSIDKDNAWSKYDNLYKLYKKAETPFSWLPKIFTYAKKINLIVFASVFDKKSFEILERLKCPAYKIASPEITDIPLIDLISKTKKPIIISNGLANFNDLNLAVKTVFKNKNKNLVLLKCTSAYPAPENEINLKTMRAISKKFKCLTGYSDHTLGLGVAAHAASIGACMLEKHVTLSNTNKSVDSFFSINTDELSILVKIIRKNEIANGIVDYNISKSSKKNFKGRRSLYVVKDIKKGEVLTAENIKSIRPRFGLHPKYLKNILNQKSKQKLKRGDRTTWRIVKK